MICLIPHEEGRTPNENPTRERVLIMQSGGEKGRRKNQVPYFRNSNCTEKSAVPNQKLSPRFRLSEQPDLGEGGTD